MTDRKRALLERYHEAAARKRHAETRRWVALVRLIRPGSDSPACAEAAHAAATDESEAARDKDILKVELQEEDAAERQRQIRSRLRLGEIGGNDNGDDDRPGATT
jgi:hypothetical protein